jgi:hypothetical protein
MGNWRNGKMAKREMAKWENGKTPVKMYLQSALVQYEVCYL